MLMDVRMYNVNANSQKGIIYVYLMTMKKGHSPKMLSLGSQKFLHSTRKFSREPQGLERALLVRYLSFRIHLKSQF